MNDTDIILDHAADLSRAWDEMAAAALVLDDDRFDRARDRFRALAARDAANPVPPALSV